MNHDKNSSSIASATLLLLAIFGVACSPSTGTVAACMQKDDGGVGVNSSALIYGNDDRLDPWQSTNRVHQILARNSVVALVDIDRVSSNDDGTYSLRGLRYQQAQGLCEGNRFAEQPVVATCSGTLIDDDLVLTAGHCVRDEETCESYRFVFGFEASESGEVAPLRASDVYACRRVVVTLDDPNNQRPTYDYAIVQLDRPVVGRRVAEVSQRPRDLKATDLVTLIGFPVGLPVKIDADGAIRNLRGYSDDFFITELDSFGGNSGSGVFSSSGRVVGILARGNGEDFADTTCNCSIERHLPTGSSLGAHVSVVAPAIAELCKDGWPSLRLCGTRPVCGDGLCTGSETTRSCARDCVDVCGDGACGTSELFACERDCEGAGALPMPPSSWTCPRIDYGSFNGCDCGCGASDPDCGSQPSASADCDEGQICSTDGVCVAGAGNPNAPADWSCLPSRYGTNDGCHCNCGVPDPDCTGLATQAAIGCGSSRYCNLEGQCELKGPTPAAWQESECDDSWYDANDGCDCACGTRDPDCDKVPEQRVYRCAQTQYCGDHGACEGASNVPASWTCDASYYGAGDECDCECGTYDPDCAREGSTVLNCSGGNPDGSTVFSCSAQGRCVALE